MSKRLQDKVAIVTGAGSSGPGWGNGKACAVQFAREGAHICAIDVSADAASETEAIIKNEGGSCTLYQGDVTESRFVENMVRECVSEFGKVDILHNNVGIVEPGGPVEIEEGNWDRLIDVNVKSMYLMVRSVLPHMVESGGGSIINVSSIASFFSLGYPCASYSASKGAINALTRNIASQYARNQIRCNAILPGLMDTPLIRGAVSGAYKDVDSMVAERTSMCPMGRMGDAWDVAHCAVFLASDESRYVTGIELVVDGGLTLTMH
jgi:NAD(P)-dependent dehydrogenase (short-subunit alcohol dehydrogenase family)